MANGSSMSGRDAANRLTNEHSWLPAKCTWKAQAPTTLHVIFDTSDTIIAPTAFGAKRMFTRINPFLLKANEWHFDSPDPKKQHPDLSYILKNLLFWYGHRDSDASAAFCSGRIALKTVETSEERNENSTFSHAWGGETKNIQCTGCGRLIRVYPALKMATGSRLPSASCFIAC